MGVDNYNVVALLEQQASERADQVAIRSKSADITFAELAELSGRGATYFRQIGLKKGDAVLVFVPMSVELYIILMALWREGLIAMFADPSSGKERLGQCCDQLQPKAFIGIPKAQILRYLTPALRHIPISISTGPTVFNKAWSAIHKCDSQRNFVQCEAEHAALITFTSGSTGLPKGTIRSHGFLLAQHKILQQTLGLKAGHSNLATLPVFALINLASGVTTLIPDANLSAPGRVDPVPILTQLSFHPTQSAVASPAFFERLLEASNLDAMQCFKSIFTGGAPVFPSLLRRLQQAMPSAEVVAVYGSTEAEPIAEISFDQINKDDFRKMASGAGLLAGPPVDDIDCRIITDQSGSTIKHLSYNEFNKLTCKVEDIGEIVVYGDHVLKGYLNGYGDTENKFRVADEVWHRTGDAGYFDDLGRLWLMGRCTAKIEDAKGILYPFAVETACKEFEHIDRVAMCCLNSQRLLVLESPLKQQDLEKDLAEIIIKFKIDRIIKQTIPVDKRHNAKVDYPALLKSISLN